MSFREYATRFAYKDENSNFSRVPLLRGRRGVDVGLGRHFLYRFFPIAFSSLIVANQLRLCGIILYLDGTLPRASDFIRYRVKQESRVLIRGEFYAVFQASMTLECHPTG